MTPKEDKYSMRQTFEQINKNFGFNIDEVMAAMKSDNKIHPVHARWLKYAWLIDTIYGHVHNENCSLGKARELVTAIIEDAHSSLLEKAAQSLPSDYEIEDAGSMYVSTTTGGCNNHSELGFIEGSKQMRKEASLLLASRDAEIERLKKRMDEMVMEMADIVSSTPEIAAAYLKSQDIDPEAEVAKGMEYINKLKEKLKPKDPH